MIAVYAVVLVTGVLALLTWIFLTVLAGDGERTVFDPERRFGLIGRRIVAGAVGFGMAGMSAEYSARDLAWPVGLLLAAAGAAATGWYAGWVSRDHPAESS